MEEKRKVVLCIAIYMSELSRCIISYRVKTPRACRCCELMSGSFLTMSLAFSSGLNAVSSSHAVWMIGDPAKPRLNFKWKRPDGETGIDRSWQLTSPRLCFYRIRYIGYIGHPRVSFSLFLSLSQEHEKIYIVFNSVSFKTEQLYKKVKKF